MAEIGEERVLQVIVKEKGEGEGGWNVTVGIPAFKSDFPTKLTRVPTSVATQMVVGTAYRIVLKRGKMKKGKDGSNIYWDYFWDWGRVATKEEQLSPSAVPAAAPEPVPGATDGLVVEEPSRVQFPVDARGRSIERQKALAEARAFIGDKMAHSDERFGTDDITAAAEVFAKWLGQPQEGE